jgi:hypothetical protein
VSGNSFEVLLVFPQRHLCLNGGIELDVLLPERFLQVLALGDVGGDTA